jgi:hypothetical protein
MDGETEAEGDEQAGQFGLADDGLEQDLLKRDAEEERDGQRQDQRDQGVQA